MKALKALTPDEESDESLMVRVTNGDRQAFARLVRKHSSRFHAHAWRMNGNRAEAEDCVQDAFLKLWRNPGAFDPGRGNKFTTWFYRVVTNAAIDLQRKRRETPDTDGLERMVAKTPLQDEVFEDQRQGKALEEAIQSLPERQRMALNLCFYDGISNADAAKIMEVNVKALESLLMRAKKTLRQRLEKDGWLETEDYYAG